MTALLTLSGAVAHDETIDRWLDAQPGELGAMARTWFDRMRQAGADVRELMHDGYATACVGDAPFAYVGVFTTHVNLGFFHGASLPDPSRLLEGSGRFMRHVKVRPGREPDPTALAALIAAAHRDIVARLKVAE